MNKTPTSHRSQPPRTKTADDQRLADRKKGNSLLVQQEENRQDLGFGTTLNDPHTRLVNKDGSFNVRRAHEGYLNHLNLYNRLITMPWPKFIGLVVSFYLSSNAVFATFYGLLGYHNLKGITEVTPDTPFGRFMGRVLF